MIRTNKFATLFLLKMFQQLKSMQETFATAVEAPSSSSLVKDDLKTDKICNLCTMPSSLRCGSQFNVSGTYEDPMNIIKNSNEFDNVITIVKQLESAGENASKLREQSREEIKANANISIQQDCCRILGEMGPPWNWLHNFTSHNCRNKSYNFLELASIRSDMTQNDEDDESSDECLFVPRPSIFDDVQSTSSSVSIIYEQDTVQPSNEHKVIVEAICNLMQSEQGDCDFRDNISIASQLSQQCERKQLEKHDYERLKKCIDRAVENGLVFNDVNALYNYFIQESSRDPNSQQEPNEQRQQDGRNDKDAEVKNLINSSSTSATPSVSSAAPVALMEVNESAAQAEMKNNENIDSIVSTTPSTSIAGDGKNVVSIFGESGIEVDNKLLDAKVSESMILGLVDKGQSEGDNVSDVPSSNASMSSLSNAETVKMKDTLHVAHEKNTQTASYRDRMHERRLQGIQKSASVSSVKGRQPFTCKIPQILGIGARLDDERIEKILKFVTFRSFLQGGFVYARNLLENECPSLK